MEEPAVKMAFQAEGLILPLDRLLPSKQINNSLRQGRKFAAILASLKEVGLVEPLIVYPVKGNRNQPAQYLILDGNVRFEAIKELGFTEVFCLVSTDDEGFTYNHKVNRLSSIQEHFMILKAVNNGVSEERIARALSVDVARIKKQRDLLNGICPEVVELLRDKPINTGLLRSLRKVKPIRQIEIAELMIAVANFTTLYAYALIAATPEEYRTEAFQEKKKRQDVTPEDLARIQKEMEALEQGIKGVEETYGPNMLNLVLARGYLAKLLANNRVVRYLSARHAEILAEFEKIIKACSLEVGG